MKLALIQMRYEKGALAANLFAIATYYGAAVAEGAEIVAFPEMSYTGYVDPTRYPAAVLRLDGPEVARLVALTRAQPATLIAGLVEANPGGEPAAGGEHAASAKPFITQVVARDGALLGFYRKLTIQAEEAAWFAPGAGVPVFRHGALTFGVAICADIGNPAVFAACAAGGARLVFELAAPGLYGEQVTRNWRSGFGWWRGECRTHLSQYAREHGLWIAVATQAGRTIDEDFPGGGYLFAPDGGCASETADWSEGAAYVDVDVPIRS
jgi:predicted amidohydrolase